MENCIKGQDEYLDIGELCDRIKYKKQTIYNRIHRKEFVLGKHYLKPNRKKLLFKWSEILKWLGEKNYNLDSDQDIDLNKNSEKIRNFRK